MSQPAQTRIVPKLRFREFNDGWRILPLGKVAKVYDGTHQTPEYKTMGVPFYSVEHVTADNFVTTKFIAENIYEVESRRVVIEKGDILMTRIGDIGTSKHISWDVKASFYVSLALIKQDDSYNSKFLDQYIKTAFFQKELWKRTIHVAFPKKINLGEISNCTVALPLEDEQAKIAAFLTIVDSKISTIQNRIASLQDYREAVTRAIFSQRVRFRDRNGDYYPAWQSKKIRDVLTGIQKNPEKNANKFELLTVKLYAKGIERTGKYPTLTERGRPYYKRDAGELLIGRQNFHNGGIGLVTTSTDGLIASNAISSFTINNNQSKLFIYYYISRPTYYKRVGNLIGGTGQKEISTTEFYNLEIKTPVLKEQQKIANFLTALDNKIKVEQDKLDRAKKFKKAMLQQMFV